jgi:hypothetical protein
MSPQQVLGFANTIEAVLKGKAEEMLDLDTPDFVRVRRIGAGFALTLWRGDDIAAAPYRCVRQGRHSALQAKLRAAAKRAVICG